MLESVDGVVDVKLDQAEATATVTMEKDTPIVAVVNAVTGRYSISPKDG